MRSMTTDPTWPEVLARVLADDDLSPAQARWAMDQVMTGQADNIAFGGLLIGLGAKGESIEEISAFAESVLAHAVPLDVGHDVLDIVGTGGDRSGTVNISSMASIVVAATGVPVLKHGNRAVSSRSGSSDFFEALGVDLDASPEQVAEIFKATGIGFAFAPKYHGGFRYAAPVRKALGVPTVFNFLGPLCNPARPKMNAIGVASERRVEVVAELLQRRGDVGLVFRGEDGLDELTTTGPSVIWEVTADGIEEYDFDPTDLDITPADLEDLVGGDAETNVEVAEEFFDGAEGSVRDIVLLNAAAGLVAALLYHDPDSSADDLTDRLGEAFDVAAEAVDSGAAREKLDEWVDAFDTDTDIDAD